MCCNSLRRNRRVASTAWLATLATVVIGAGASASGAVVLYVDDDRNLCQIVDGVDSPHFGLGDP